MRTTYINFLMDVGATPKTTQSLARHATLEITINVYGRAREDNRRGAVEALGDLIRTAADWKIFRQAIILRCALLPYCNERVWTS